jgi:hypothetical protein
MLEPEKSATEQTLVGKQKPVVAADEDSKANLVVAAAGAEPSAEERGRLYRAEKNAWEGATGGCMLLVDTGSIGVNIDVSLDPTYTVKFNCFTGVSDAEQQAAGKLREGMVLTHVNGLDQKGADFDAVCNVLRDRPCKLQFVVSKVAQAPVPTGQVHEKQLGALDLQADADLFLTISNLISKTDYINARVRLVHGKRVREAVGTLVPNTKGRTVKYKFGDLKYDVQRGLLLVGGEERPRPCTAPVAASRPKSRLSSKTPSRKGPLHPVPAEPAPAEEGRRSSRRRSAKRVSYKEHEETKPNFTVQAIHPRDIFDAEWRQGSTDAEVKLCALCQLPEGSSDKADFLNVTWKWLKGGSF